MRCPVPYALLALFGWGLVDVLVLAARARLAQIRAVLSRARRTVAA